MFYCEQCRVKKDWPVSILGSRGPCEICGKVGENHDTPSRRLPLPPKAFLGYEGPVEMIGTGLAESLAADPVNKTTVTLTTGEVITFPPNKSFFDIVEDCYHLPRGFLNPTNLSPEVGGYIDRFLERQEEKRSPRMNIDLGPVNPKRLVSGVEIKTISQEDMGKTGLFDHNALICATLRKGRTFLDNEGHGVFVREKDVWFQYHYPSYPGVSIRWETHVVSPGTDTVLTSEVGYHTVTVEDSVIRPEFDLIFKSGMYSPYLPLIATDPIDTETFLNRGPAGGCHRINRDQQKLIDLCFELVLTATGDPIFCAKTVEEKAIWVVEKLRNGGFDTTPVGASWGVLKENTTTVYPREAVNEMTCSVLGLEKIWESLLKIPIKDLRDRMAPEMDLEKFEKILRGGIDVRLVSPREES
jgi:hypothetical protein